MSVFKYFSLEGGLRFLSTWALRITPPDQFNDPFEMRPRFTAMTISRAQESFPDVLREELTKVFTEQAAKEGVAVREEQLTAVVSYLMASTNDEGANEFVQRLGTTPDPKASAILDGFRFQIQASLPTLWTQIDSQMPVFNQAFENAIGTSLRKFMGVTCLSGSQKNPLMWSHYADGHQGLMIEFNETHSTFNRRRHSSDEFGFLRRVAYSDTRPNIELLEGDEVFVQMALIKALDWAYEQEQRFIWPLELADRQVATSSETIYLIDVPPSAIKTVTMGCKASDAAFQKVTAELSNHRAAAHVNRRRSKIADDCFELLYLPIE